MSLAIRKGVPIPYKRSAYPFGDMEVGDSIFIDGGHREYGPGANAYAVVRKFQSKSGRKFITRLTNGGFGIWRVS